ncbi:hypothetical protein GCM10022226_59930 [Sphaerisporangium flaviroseum]|uniref:DNA-binding protein n=1 Tax=Sphaerisporangium flaviroseum TaxID=509199 RepID=A0ABP7J010_9ACTN
MLRQHAASITVLQEQKLFPGYPDHRDHPDRRDLVAHEVLGAPQGLARCQRFRSNRCPCSRKIGRDLRYVPEDVMSWVREQE